jgi:hypothetical protein
MTWGDPPPFIAKQAEKRIIPDDVRLRQNAARLAVRKARVDKGLCRDCGNWPYLKDKVVCSQCDIKRTNGNKIIKNRLILNGKCTVCSKPHSRGTTLCLACSNRSVNNFRLARKRNKEFIVNYFGGKCKDCGELDIRCLSLDHINNDGRLDKISDNGKKQISPTWYAKLVKLITKNKPLPRELQLLCFNCHAKKDLQPWWFKDDMEQRS